MTDIGKTTKEAFFKGYAKGYCMAYDNGEKPPFELPAKNLLQDAFFQGYSYGLQDREDNTPSDSLFAWNTFKFIEGY